MLFLFQFYFYFQIKILLQLLHALFIINKTEYLSFGFNIHKHCISSEKTYKTLASKTSQSQNQKQPIHLSHTHPHLPKTLRGGRAAAAARVKVSNTHTHTRTSYIHSSGSPRRPLACSISDRGPHCDVVGGVRVSRKPPKKRKETLTTSVRVVRLSRKVKGVQFSQRTSTRRGITEQ